MKITPESAFQYDVRKHRDPLLPLLTIYVSGAFIPKNGRTAEILFGSQTVELMCLNEGDGFTIETLDDSEDILIQTFQRDTYKSIDAFQLRLKNKKKNSQGYQDKRLCLTRTSLVRQLVKVRGDSSPENIIRLDYQLEDSSRGEYPPRTYRLRFLKAFRRPQKPKN